MKFTRGCTTSDGWCLTWRPSRKLCWAWRCRKRVSVLGEQMKKIQVFNSDILTLKLTESKASVWWTCCFLQVWRKSSRLFETRSKRWRVRSRENWRVSLCDKRANTSVFICLFLTHRSSFLRYRIKERRGGREIYPHKSSDAADPGWLFKSLTSTFHHQISELCMKLDEMFYSTDSQKCKPERSIATESLNKLLSQYFLWADFVV